MITPLYKEYKTLPSKPEHAHTGLWFDRFFNRYDSDWQLGNEAKQAWIKQVKGQTGNLLRLEAFTQRQTALVTQLNGSSKRYTSDWHFITGMGNAHPVENGFSWHPTLAVPYLTGASVKGLVRAWVELNDDDLDKDAREARLKSWFGTSDKGDIAEQAGDFIFFDALPDEPAMLACDIMTPHMGDWYSEGDKATLKNSRTIPADWHEPVPVPFLVVKNTRLVFHIAPRNEKYKADLELVMSALTQALDWLGAGAKTAAGYGYFTEDQTFAESLKQSQVEEQLKQQEKQRIANLSPVEQELETFLKSIQEAEHSTRLLTELATDRWQGDDKKRVAEKVKKIMQETDKWLPDFIGTNKKKLKLKERSLIVLSYLEE